MLVGVKSTALLFGEQTSSVLTGFSVAMAGLLALSGYNASQTLAYYITVLLAYGHLQHQVSLGVVDG